MRKTRTVRISKKLAEKLEEIAKRKNKSVTTLKPSDLTKKQRIRKDGNRGNRNDYFGRMLNHKLEKNVIR